MKNLLTVFVGLVIGCWIGIFLLPAQEPTAIQPHPLDDAFLNLKQEDDVQRGLDASELYRKARKNAFKAYQDQNKEKKPGFVGPTPAQSALSCGTGEGRDHERR
jgi:hypothetical protein